MGFRSKRDIKEMDTSYRLCHWHDYGVHQVEYVTDIKARGRLKWWAAKEKSTLKEILKTIRGKTLVRKSMLTQSHCREVKDMYMLPATALHKRKRVQSVL